MKDHVLCSAHVSPYTHKVTIAALCVGVFAHSFVRPLQLNSHSPARSNIADFAIVVLALVLVLFTRWLLSTTIRYYELKQHCEDQLYKQKQQNIFLLHVTTYICMCVCTLHLIISKKQSFFVVLLLVSVVVRVWFLSLASSNFDDDDDERARRRDVIKIVQGGKCSLRHETWPIWTLATWEQHNNNNKKTSSLSFHLSSRLFHLVTQTLSLFKILSRARAISVYRSLYLALLTRCQASILNWSIRIRSPRDYFSSFSSTVQLFLRRCIFLIYSNNYKKSPATTFWQ